MLSIQSTESGASTGSGSSGMVTLDFHLSRPTRRRSRDEDILRDPFGHNPLGGASQQEIIRRLSKTSYMEEDLSADSAEYVPKIPSLWPMEFSNLSNRGSETQIGGRHWSGGGLLDKVQQEMERAGWDPAKAAKESSAADPGQTFSNFDDPWMAAPALSEDFA